MTFAWIFSDDNRHNNWIFSNETPNEGRKLRNRYLHLACPQCGKIDELKALRLGIDDDVRIRSRFDYFDSSDNVIIASQPFKDLVEVMGNPDCEFIPLPGDSRYFICLVHTILPCEPNPPGMRFYDQCSECGRFLDTTGGPMLTSLKLPQTPFLLSHPDVQHECRFGRKWFNLASETFIKAFKKSKLKGIDFLEAR
jgi:hypothetical protein